MLDFIFSQEFVISVLRLATPIIYASLACTIAFKANITNIGIEGVMLFSALMGVIFSSLFGSAYIGLLVTVVIGGLIGLFIGLCIFKLGVNEIITGVGFNLIVSGAIPLILFWYSGDRGVSANIESMQIGNLSFGNLQFFSSINILTYFAIILSFVFYFLIYKTAFGLQLRAVGENYKASEFTGIKAKKIQYMAIILSCCVGAIGGFYFSGGYLTKFTANMTAGRGYIGLAISVIGGVNPLGSLLVSVVFGAIQAISDIMQLFSLPSEIALMLPYVLMLLIVGVHGYFKEKYF